METVKLIKNMQSLSELVNAVHIQQMQWQPFFTLGQAPVTQYDLKAHHKTWKIIDYLMAFLVDGPLSTCKRCREYEGGWKRTNCHLVLSESEKTPCHFKLSLISQNDREEIIDCMKMSLKNMYHYPLFTYYTAICSIAFSLFNLAECGDGCGKLLFFFSELPW